MTLPVSELATAPRADLVDELTHLRELIVDALDNPLDEDHESGACSCKCRPGGKTPGPLYDRLMAQKRAARELVAYRRAIVASR